MVLRFMSGISLDRSVTSCGALFLLAITGSMGCGKSAVSRVLQRKGAKLLDADQDARAVLIPGSEGWQAVVEQFGRTILVEDGSPFSSLSSDGHPAEIDRKALGKRVFHDPEARAALEAIVHPRIYRRQASLLRQWHNATIAGEVTVVVAEIPLLFETGGEKRFDWTVAVFCREQQWQRLQERTTMSLDVKRAIIAQQLPEDEKCQRANRTIDNSGPWRDTERQIEMLWSELQNSVRQEIQKNQEIQEVQKIQKIQKIQKRERSGCFAWPHLWPETAHYSN